MVQARIGGLEEALARTESEVGQALKSTELLKRELARCFKAASVGDLKAVEDALRKAEEAASAASQWAKNLREGWTFNARQHLESGAFVAELLSAAGHAGLPLTEADGRLFSYPVIIRVQSADLAVRIEKKLERKIRPSALVSQLKKLRSKESRARPEAFLTALERAYRKLVGPQLGLPRTPPQVKLGDIYELLTLLPGSATDYGLAEFMREVYEVDRSGQRQTRSGARVEFVASARPGQEKGTQKAVTQTGDVKYYAGVRFVQS